MAAISDPTDKGQPPTLPYAGGVEDDVLMTACTWQCKAVQILLLDRTIRTDDVCL